MANSKLVAGPGRPKGSHNLVNKSMAQTLEEMGCSPAMGLAKIAMDTMNSVKDRVSAYSTLAKYMYPQARLVEVTGENKGPLQMKITWADEETNGPDDSSN